MDLFIGPVLLTVLYIIYVASRFMQIIALSACTVWLYNDAFY